MSLNQICTAGIYHAMTTEELDSDDRLRARCFMVRHYNKTHKGFIILLRFNNYQV